MPSPGSGYKLGQPGHMTIVLLSMLCLAPPALSEELNRYAPEWTEVREAERAFAYDAGKMTENDARTVAGHFFEAFGEGAFPSIYGIPGRDRLFLVSGSMDHRGETDFGLRFFLVEEADGVLRRTFRGRGSGDSYSLDPTFYWDDARVLILAETGAEYSWGLWAYELSGSTLEDLGPLDVTFWSGENHVNPLDHARVSFERGRYRVEFRVDLTLDPGGLHTWHLIRAGEAIIFEQNVDRFRLSTGSIGGQVCFFYLGETLSEEDNETLSDLRHHYRQLIPWLEKNRLSHSFQQEATLQMVSVGDGETSLSHSDLKTDLGVLLMTKNGDRKVLPGVSTDVDLILEMRPFFGIDQ